MKHRLIIAVLLSSLLVGGCVESAPETIDSDTGTLKQTLKGVSLSPRSFEADDFTDFFDKAKQAGDVVMWAGDWIELGNTGGGGATVTAELALTYNYIPLIEAHFFTQSSGELVRPLDDATKQIYRNSAADFADRYKPEYLVFGIEVNALYEKSPEDFDEFVEFFSEVYDDVKARSPSTKVFTTFQLERIKGLQGGLFGGENDQVSLSQWSLLDRFPKSDLNAFTTYPCLIYKAPSEIPLDYYSEITGIEPVVVGLRGGQVTVRNPRLRGIVRPLAFEVSDTVNADIEAACNAKAGRMFASVVNYSCNVATWRDPSGNIWKPNTTVTIDAPGAMIYGEYEFLVRAVTLSRTSDGGEVATLALTIPGAFNSEIPEALPWD